MRERESLRKRESLRERGATRERDRRRSRATSTPLGYVLTLTIATLLVSGLLVSAGAVVEDRREAAAREQLEVAGQRLAADIATADRLVEADGEEVAVRTDAPGTVVGGSYSVTVEATPGESRLRLTADDPDVTVEVPFANQTAVRNTSVRGGDLRVVLDGNELEVESQ